jgi:phosphopantetheine adenylyltransferase
MSKQNDVCEICTKEMHDEAAISDIVDNTVEDMEVDIKIVQLENRMQNGIINEALNDRIKDIDIATAEMLEAEEAFKLSKRVLKNLNKKLKHHHNKILR